MVRTVPHSTDHSSPLLQLLRQHYRHFYAHSKPPLSYFTHQCHYPILLSSLLLPISLPMSLSLLFSLSLLIASRSLQQQQQPEQPPPPWLLLPNKCNDKCGDLQIPFPFYLNASCATISDSFRVSCLNNLTTPFLTINSQRYRVLGFLPDGLLVDFPGNYSCRQYNDLSGFDFGGNSYFAISVDNVVGLYDCEDSSLCKAGCETNSMPGCHGNAGPSPACCYPLTDHSVWQVGNDFSTFSQFGCRGFSCWVVVPGTNYGKRGVKVEWAIPRNSSKGVCSNNAYPVNSTAVASGMRCLCQDGLAGDGFADGIGCLKSCNKNGQEAYGNSCYAKTQSKGMAVILAGVLAPIFIIASLCALFCLLKRPAKSTTFNTDQAHFNSTVSFQKACRTRLYAYHELEEATKGFEDSQKLTDGSNNTVYAGILCDGLHVAVHRVQSGSERDLIEVLSRVEVLCAVVHRNMACILGCCIDSGHAPLVVYEYPAMGSLEEHLHQGKGRGLDLDWYNRLNIATETASFLAFLQCEISPPIFHHNLKSAFIFLDQDFSAKISGFGLLNSFSSTGSPSSNNRSKSTTFYRSDVYDLGVVLLDILAGSKHLDQPTVGLQKIRSGKLEELVDPHLNYHEQPVFRREQIERVADLATRCLLFGGDGKLGMVDVARELVHIKEESIDGSSKRGPALEETFSNSSLLQMISMSPDSIYVP